MVLRRELSGNAVDEKSVAEGIGVWYQEDPRWAKKSIPPVRAWGWGEVGRGVTGWEFEKPPELYCIFENGVQLYIYTLSFSTL